MRVTDRMTFEGAQTRTARSREALERANAEIASGVRVDTPWSDPGAAGFILSQTGNLERLAATRKTTEQAVLELEAADTALATMGDVLSRARELATQLSNPSYNGSQRSAAAQEVRGIVQSLLAQANVKFNNRFLFGGDRDGSAPFDANGNYLGDTAVRQIEIAPGIFQDVSVRSDVALKGAGGGVDVLGEVESLAVALETNDVAGVRATLTGLEAGVSQVASARVQSGTIVNVLETVGAAAMATSTSLAAARSKIQETDLVDAGTRMALAQRSLEATLQSSAQSFRLTLLSYLR
ncbi:MAG: flagellar biosynthesis protein FlgL [Deltaproteobacteria bacterium]|nr:flagellar biosynthesis protein FlgL [Deltaproteobacteria bacterium]